MSHRTVVIKITRSSRCSTEAAKEKIKTMKFLNQLDFDHQNFLHYFGSFIHKSHVCLIFERPGLSLFSVLQEPDFHPFSRAVIHSVMRQLVDAVGILHHNDVIHTNLKLENILLTGVRIFPDRRTRASGHFEAGIWLIDFELSDSDCLWHRRLVTTRYCQAPEILMGLRWGDQCDIWSLGCILVELAVGKIDFDAKDPIEHLCLIQEMIAEIPR
jgi:dual-specificity kinase